MKNEKSMEKISNELIDKVLDGVATKEEAKSVAQWFRTDEGQRYLSKRMEEDFMDEKNGLEDLKVNHKIPSEIMLDHIINHIEKKSRRLTILKIAAAIIPLVLFAGLFFQVSKKVDLFGAASYDELIIPKGERIQFMFQDGTRVYLNSESKLRYPREFGLSERRVQLEGEGYFIVSPNPDRPFIVELDKAKIKVLGTAFNVEAYPEEKEICVTLDKGKVNLIPWTNKENLLNPNEKIILNKESGNCTITKLDNVQSLSTWKKDIITFNNAPLNEVMKDLSRWYNVRFVVKDKRAYGYLFTITSNNTLLENVLKELEIISPVKFIYENKTVTIQMQ